MVKEMSNQLQLASDKSISLKRARRNSKTLVELTIGIIGLSGLLMAQLGQPNQRDIISQAVSAPSTSRLVKMVSAEASQDRHLVTFRLRQSEGLVSDALTASKSCQTSWLGVLL